MSYDRIRISLESLVANFLISHAARCQKCVNNLSNQFPKTSLKRSLLGYSWQEVSDIQTPETRYFT